MINSDKEKKNRLSEKKKTRSMTETNVVVVIIIVIAGNARRRSWTDCRRGSRRHDLNDCCILLSFVSSRRFVSRSAMKKETRSRSAFELNVLNVQPTLVSNLDSFLLLFPYNHKPCVRFRCKRSVLRQPSKSAVVRFGSYGPVDRIGS